MATSDDAPQAAFEPDTEDLDEVWDAIDTLQDEADTEAVDLLLEVLMHLLDENHRQRRRMSALEDRLSKVERHVGVTQEDELTVDSPQFDRRDQSVLSVLAEENPDHVSLSRLQELYRRTTDVRNKQTLKERIRGLVRHGPLETTDRMNTYEYIGEH